MSSYVPRVTYEHNRTDFLIFDDSSFLCDVPYKFWVRKKKNNHTSCSEESNLRYFLMKSIRPCTVRILSIVHFLFFMIGVSPTALSRTSTRKQKLQISTLSFLLVAIEPTYYAALYT